MAARKNRKRRRLLARNSAADQDRTGERVTGIEPA
jgi:hypothetical protein